jgi:hypothetical protein
MVGTPLYIQTGDLPALRRLLAEHLDGSDHVTMIGRLDQPTPWPALLSC